MATGSRGDHGTPPFPDQLIPADPNAPTAGPAGGWSCADYCGPKLWVWAVSTDGTRNAQQCVSCGYLDG